MKLADPVVRFITGRRTKWIVLAVWIVIAVVSVPLAGKLSSLQTNDQKSGLPAGAAGPACPQPTAADV